MLKYCLFILFTCSIAATSLAQQAPSVDDPAEEAYQKRIKRTRINSVYIPKDLYDSFTQLDRLMDVPTRNKFKSLTEEEAGKKFYLIMWMCNNWGFYEGSRLSHYVRQMGITNPEHMAHFIITAYHRQLNEQDLGIKERVTFYQKKTAEAQERKKKNQTIIHEETRQRPRN